MNSDKQVTYENDAIKSETGACPLSVQKKMSKEREVMMANGSNIIIRKQYLLML